MCIEKRMADTYRVSVIFLLLFTANVPGGVFPKGMLRDAKQNPEAASAIWSGMLHICASRSVLLDTQ
jgi:hypothetical protein